MTAGPGPQAAATSAPEQPSVTRMRGDIEGLRAIAVLLVLLYHLGISALSGGFAGVDVFFVISGFLITSHLLSEVEKTGRVRIGRFYARRARRLLPAAALVLIVTVLLGYLLLPVVNHRNLSIDAVLATLYVVNWGFANRSVDYLAEDAAASPLQHYWSLSVEEQFYVVVPLLLLLIGWWATRRGLSVRKVAGIALGALVAGSLAYSIWLTGTDPATAYFVTPTRIWELAVGSVLACILPALQRLARRACLLLALTGAVLLAWTAFATDTTTPWPGSAALLPVLGTALIIAAGCGRHETVVSRALSVRPMVWIGGLSYAIYLWHWPLIVFAEAQGITGVPMMLGVTAATVAASVMSRRWVENPIRFGTMWSASTARGLAVGAIGMAVSIAAAGALWASIPSATDRPTDLVGAGALGESHATPAPTEPPSTDPSSTDDPTEGSTPEPSRPGYASTGTVVPEPALAEQDLPRVYEDECQLPRTATEPKLDCVYGDPDSDHVVAIVGDSKMAQWTSPLIAIAEAEGWRLEVYTKSACGVNTGFAVDPDGYPECVTWGAAVVDHLTADPGRVQTVIASMGRSSVDPDEQVIEQRYVDGNAEVWQRLENSGIEVVVLLDNPYPTSSQLPSNVDSVYSCVAEHRDDWSVCETDVWETRGGRPAMFAALEELPDVGSIDLGELICPQGTCPPVIGEVLVWRQGSHITDTYALSLQEALWQGLIDEGAAEGPVRPPVFQD